MARLEAGGAEVETSWTRGPGWGPSSVELPAAADTVVAAGGDGTLHQVANAMYSRGDGRALAFLPLGTVNVFRQEARLPAGTAGVADLVLDGRTDEYRPGLGSFTGLDGAPEERIFLLMAGVGWDARVVMSVGSTAKKLHGRGAYLLAGLRLLLGGAAEKVEMAADGRRMEGACLVAAVSPWYGGRNSLVPSARSSSAGLSLAVVREVTLGGALALAWRAMTLRPDTSGRVAYVEAGEVSVASPGSPIQMDGDPVGFAPARFARAPRALRMILGGG